MSLINYIIKVVLIVITIFITSCSTDENMNIEGQLVYTTGGNSINSIDLGVSEYTYSSLYSSKGITAINHLTKKSNDVILFSECAIGECVIKEYSVMNGKITSLHSGIWPSYISNHNKLFFYDTIPDEDKSNWLFATTLKGENAIIKIAKEPKWKTLPNGISHPITIAPIQISNDEILFIGEDEKLLLYNIVNAKLTSMDIENCRPMLWIDRRGQLLCLNWITWELFLLDIDTRNKIDLPELKDTYGFVYVSGLDALVYGRTRSRALIGEAPDIFLYLFTDKKEIKIRENSHIAGGVWLNKHQNKKVARKGSH